MTQYAQEVENVRLRTEAEEWARAVKSIHVHSLSSMYYDNRPEDTEDGKSVLDVQYNDGTVRRTTSDGGTIVFGKALTGQKLIDAYVRNT